MLDLKDTEYEMALAANEVDEAKVADRMRTTMQLVSLDAMRNNEYEGFFHPNGKKTIFRGMFDSVGQTFAQLNTFMYVLRRISKNANWYSTQDQDTLAENINSAFTQYFKQAEPIIQGTSANFWDKNNGGDKLIAHYVIPSQRYTGGFDIIQNFNTTVTDANTSNNAQFGLGASIHGAGSNDLEAMSGPAAEQQKYSIWYSDFGTKLSAAVEEIYEHLYKDKNPSVNTKRNTVTLDFDFAKVQDIFTKHVGVTLDHQYIENIEFNFAPELAEQFLRLDIVGLPDVRLSNQVIYKMGQEPGADLRDANRANSELQQMVSKEGYFINVKPIPMMRITLEEDIARYISQTTDDARVSVGLLHNWFSIWRSQYWRFGGGVEKISADAVPRYLIAPSMMPTIANRKKANGYVTENTRANEDGLYIHSSGTFKTRPSMEDYQNSPLAKDYESAVNQARSAKAEISDLNTRFLPEAAGSRLTELDSNLRKFGNVVIAHDWDTGTDVIVDGNGNYKARSQIGAVRPDPLAIADFLGFDFAKDGERPIQKDFATAMYMLTTYSSDANQIEQHAQSAYGHKYKQTAMLTGNSSVFQAIQLYHYLAYVEEKAPKIEQLLQNAQRNQPLVNEEDSLNFAAPYTRTGYITQAGLLARNATPLEVILDVVGTALVSVSSNVQGALFNIKRRELAGGNNTYISNTEVYEEVENDVRFFEPHTSPMHHFGRVYNTFGGHVLRQIFDAIVAQPVSYYGKLLSSKGTYEDNMGRTVTTANLSNHVILDHVYPVALMLGKYVPDSERILEEAQKIADSLEPEEGFTSEDIIVPGLQEDRFLFPHQVDTQAHLRRPIPPAFAILALEPGGGKTGQGAIDVATLMGDMQEVGERVIPMIIAPNGLLGQWAGDIKYFLGDSFNVFPINSETKDRWTQEELLEMMRTAPVNTIYLVSMSFLSANTVPVTVGTETIRISANVELIKQIGANYVAIDESHNLKSFSTSRHKFIKQITTSTTVKWIRLLTGTLVPDRAKDIEGQVALYSPHIFRAGEIADISSAKVGDDVITSGNKLDGERAMAKLSRYCSLIIKRRKEWAFMLPVPIESVYEVDMVNKDAPEEEQKLQRLHEEMYNYILDQTISQLGAEFDAQDKAEKRKSRGNSDDDDQIVEDEDFDGLQNLDGASWDKHVANFIRLCTAPQSLHTEFSEIFGKIYGNDSPVIRDFKPNKIQVIAKLADAHFNPPKWNTEGKVHYYGTQARPLREYDLVQYKDDLYVVRKFSKGTAKVELPASEYNKAPDTNPDYWKKEPPGKLIIVTRFDSTGDSIYNALPSHLQSQAVVFNGSAKDPKESFRQFRTSDKVQILIANEQRITEGYNLQLASRIIRVEQPWGPGAISQTQARILRPDPKAALSKQTTRDVIYLDNVLTSNSVESAQYARIIMKTFGTYKLLEASNPVFRELLNWETPDPSNVPELKLGAKMLKNRMGIADEPFSEMVDKMKELNDIQNAEFFEMKRTQKSDLEPITPKEKVAGSDTVKYLPFVDNQPIPDPKGWEPTHIPEFIERNKITDYKDLVGQPVITEFGTGMIVEVFTKRKSNEISDGGIKVRLKDPKPGHDIFQRMKPTLCLIPDRAAISSKDMEDLFKVPLHATATAEKNAERQQRLLEQQLREQEEQEEREQEIERKQQEREARIKRKEIQDSEKRRENVKKNLPPNEGIVKGDVGKTKLMEGDAVLPKQKEPVEPEELPTVDLYASYYHGYATVEAIPDEGVDLKPLGFNFMGAYAFIEVSNKHRFHTIIDWIEANFDISPQTENRLIEINKAFDPGRTNTKKLWYKLDLAPMSTLPAFFQTKKRIVQNRKELRVYPVFNHDHVMLCVDIRTNPAIVPFLGKAIPGAATKWQRSDGHWFYFGRNKTDLKAKMQEVAKKFSVPHLRESLKELAGLQMHTKKKK